MKKPLVERQAKPKSVYGLQDPRTGQFFYVGESGQPEKRFFDHLGLAFTNLGYTNVMVNREKDRAIREVLLSGHFPVLVILDVPGGETEKHWIDKLRSQGHHLTNQKTGSRVMTTELRERRSQIMRERWADPVSRAKLSSSAVRGWEKRRGT